MPPQSDESTPPSSIPGNTNSDVVQQMIDLCLRDLEAIAQALDYAAAESDPERAIRAILDIQASALLHGFDEIAVLATEAEHAVEMTSDTPSSWKEVSQRLVTLCRQPSPSTLSALSTPASPNSPHSPSTDQVA